MTKDTEIFKMAYKYYSNNVVSGIFLFSNVSQSDNIVGIIRQHFCQVCFQFLRWFVRQILRSEKVTDADDEVRRTVITVHVPLIDIKPRRAENEIVLFRFQILH